jgi:hypothetical protein
MGPDIDWTAPDSASPFLRERTIDGVRLQIDAGPQVIWIDLPDEGAEDSAHAVPAATPAGLSWVWRGGERVAAMTSAALLAHKAKQFDDGFYAAIELAAWQGGSAFAGKLALLRALAEALAREPPDEATTAIEAAARLGGVAVKLPEAMEEAVSRAILEFDADPGRSKPIAFYTWSPALTAIFRQDRMLQTKLDGAGIGAIVKCLESDASLLSTYGAWLRLNSRLTNPGVAELADLRELFVANGEALAKPVCFCPPARGHETELVKRLFQGRPIPEGFSLADELAKVIRDGSIDLAPTEDSGWYDWQTWALETLAAPQRALEAKKLEILPDYGEALFDLFKALLGLMRETHIKALEIPDVAESMPEEERVVTLTPALRVEPLATHYLRRALGYRFVRGAVESVLGSKALVALRRQGPEGPAAVSLDDELAQMEALFLGAYACACEDLGMAADADAAAAQALPAFVAWRDQISSDADLGRDARMMVPLFYDLQRQQTKVLVFLGWSMRAAHVGFREPPLVEQADVSSGYVDVRFESDLEQLVCPVTAELYVDRVRDRSEMRAICDAKKTREAILLALAQDAPGAQRRPR